MRWGDFSSFISQHMTGVGSAGTQAHLQLPRRVARARPQRLQELDAEVLIAPGVFVTSGGSKIEVSGEYHIMIRCILLQTVVQHDCRRLRGTSRPQY